MPVWLHSMDDCDGGAVAQRLVGAGVDVVAIESESWPGIVLFRDASPPLLDFLHERSRGGVVRVLTVAAPGAVLSSGLIWQLLQAGACDVVCWDGVSDPLAEIVERLRRWQAVDALVDSASVCSMLVGQSAAWKGVVRQVVEYAHFSDASMLILGESGTGKELVARLVHHLDARPAKGDLVVLDCTTVAPELAGSEFFGHERGAFTHAVSARDGAFALADGGTLFLDEIGELPLVLQAQLLRVIQERVFKRVGGNTWQATDFRLICATNRDLMAGVRNGSFRADLYYRIAACVVGLPPLRDRVGDILPLAQHFMRQHRPDRVAPALDPAVSAYLLNREYPGNVRDLRQVVHRIMHRHVGPGPITAGDVPEDERPLMETAAKDWRDAAFDQAIARALSLGVGLKSIGRAAEDTAVRLALAAANGNLRRAAERLDVTDRALQMRRAAWRRDG